MSRQANSHRYEDEDDAEDSTWGERKTRSKKSRREPNDDVSNANDDQVDVDDEDDFSINDGFDADLMGDAADRAHLLSLPEIEREKILFERVERRQAMMERLEVRRRLRAQQLTLTDDRKVVSKTRTVKSKTRKSLSVLKARRANKGRRRSALREDEDDEDDLVEKEEDSDEYSSDEDNFIDRSWDSQELSDDDEKTKDAKDEISMKPKEIPPISLEDMNALRLSRRRLAMWVHFPFFDIDMKGLFVRIGLGYSSRGESVYYIAEIVDIKRESKLYTLEHTKTNKVLVLRSGSQLRTFPMSHVSNGDFTGTEFEKWSTDQQKPGARRLNPEEARTRASLYRQMRVRAITHEEIDACLAEQELLGIRMRHNLSLDKASLQRERDIAVIEGSQQDVQRLDEQIRRLEDESTLKNSANHRRLEEISKINQKNRLQNLKDVREEQLNVAKNNTGSNRDELDPFARRRCRPDMMANALKSPLKSLEDSSIENALAGKIDQKDAQKSDYNASSTVFVVDKHVDLNDPFTHMHSSLDIDIDLSKLPSKPSR